MATPPMSRLIHDLHRDEGLSDAALLGAFIAQRDELAFEMLVRRHGPMVLGVCRRVLVQVQDVEDAFQATFLVLVRRAASIRERETLAGWLHGVAHRTALAARRANARRATMEKQVMEMPHPGVTPDQTWLDLQPVLDHQLNSLPEKFRLPIVLCDLEGRTQREAARQLGIPHGTLSNRLTTARNLLARRLARHGVTLSASSIVTIVSQNPVSARVPTALVESTLRCAAAVAAGKATATALVSARVAALTEGVLKAMLIAKTKLAMAVLVALTILTAGVGGFAYTTQPAKPTRQPQEGQPEKKQPVSEDAELHKLRAELEKAREHLQQVNEVVAAARERFLKARQQYETARRKGLPPEPKTVTGTLVKLDPEENTIRLEMWVETKEPDADLLGTPFQGFSGRVYENYTPTEDVVILQDNVRTKLADLKLGSRLSLKYEGEKLVSITADGGTVQARYVSTNPVRNTIAVLVGDKKERNIYHLIRETEVLTETGRPARVQDLKDGTEVLLTRSVEDVNTVIRIQPVPASRGR